MRIPAACSSHRHGVQHGAHRGAQRGAALFTTLMMLAMIMLLGASAAQMTLMHEKSARNSRDRDISFRAAEAALQDALFDLRSGRADAARAASAFPAVPGSCHSDAAFAGLCLGKVRPSLPSAQQLAQAIPFGSFTSRRFAHGAGALAIEAPRYLIELLSLPPASQDGAAAPVLRYRITALGFGPHRHSRVVLQAVHEVGSTNPASNPATATHVGRRLSWREITDILP